MQVGILKVFAFSLYKEIIITNKKCSEIYKEILKKDYKTYIM